MEVFGSRLKDFPWLDKDFPSFSETQELDGHRYEFEGGRIACFVLYIVRYDSFSGSYETWMITLFFKF